MPNLVDDPSWYKALTLSERLNPDILAGPDVSSTTPANVGETAQERLFYWRNQPPFNKGEFFAQRLAMDSLTEDRMLILLSESIVALKARCLQLPGWLGFLASADFSAKPETSNGCATPSSQSNTGAFLVAFTPWLHAAKLELHNRI